MGSFFQDLRYGIRMLLKSKAFTAIAVLSLALGIGANTALFSLIDAVMLKMLPVRNPSELVLFNWLSGPRGLSRGITGTTNRDPNGMTTSTSFSYPAFERIRDNNQTLSDVFAFAQLYELNVSVDGQPEIAGGQLVSGNYYSGLGVRAIMGRTIAADDDTAAANPVVVITHRYWQRSFAGDPEIVGRTVFVNNVPATIIGVTPPEFFGALQVGQSADLSIPFSIQPRLNPGENNLTKPWYWWVQIMGRLNPGVTGEQAAAGFEGIFQQSAQEGWTAALTQLPSNARVLDPAPRDVPKLRWSSGSQGLTEARRDYSQPLSILMVIVGLVLLISCANVANLLLARSATRQKEIAVRLAMGATRWRLVRQLLTESVLLAGLGGAAGVLFAYWGKDLLLTLRPWGGGDALTISFAVLTMISVAAVAGYLPARRAARVDPMVALRYE